MAWDNNVDFLSVDRDGNTVVAAPFPVSIDDAAAHIASRKGVSYQVLVNGQEILDVESAGRDMVPLRYRSMNR